MRSIIFFLSLTLLLHPVSSFAQADWKNWNTAQLTLSFTKKLDLKLSHLRAFNISNGYSPDFNQSSVHLNYGLTKKIDLSAGYTFSGSTSIADGGSRVWAKGGYKLRLAKVLTWSNSLQGEIHDKGENRYHYRMIWQTRLSPRKRLDFLNLSPSISYSLFYNIGGTPINYYDKDGTVITRQTPDGFHRGRLMLSLNSKITKSFSVSLYYMHQQEFNLFSSDLRKINVVNPVTGKVARRFDNYNVAGLTLSYDINLYKTKKKN